MGSMLVATGVRNECRLQLACSGEGIEGLVQQLAVVSRPCLTQEHAINLLCALDAILQLAGELKGLFM